MVKLNNKITVGISCNVPIWVILGPADCVHSIVAVFTDKKAAMTHWKKLEKAEAGVYPKPKKMHTNWPIKQCVGFKDKAMTKAIYV